MVSIPAERKESAMKISVIHTDVCYEGDWVFIRM
jgi:hypothetical protein